MTRGRRGEDIVRRDLVGPWSASRGRLAMGWHIEIIAAKLTALCDGQIGRLIVNLPPRHQHDAAAYGEPVLGLRNR